MRVPMVMISLRVPGTMKAELERMAAEATEQTGRKVSRGEVHRKITADGIRRDRIARTYTDRYEGRTDG